MTSTKTYMTERCGVLGDPAASYWLKNAILALEVRDPCNALGDVKMLLELQRLRLKMGPPPREAFEAVGLEGFIKERHKHDWQPTDNYLIDRCSICGEERA